MSRRTAARDSRARIVGRLLWAIVFPGLVLGCSRDERATPPPAEASPAEVALAGATVMIGVGDIAVCERGGDEATARIVDSVLAADGAAKVETVVATFGDNAYPSGPNGVDRDFPRCFSPSWGTKRIMRVIHPSPGNHDYDSGDGTPYFTYFGDRAGPRGKGYYSYDVGSWHAVSLNSELYFEHGSPAEAKAQEDWLRADLIAHPALCTVAYFHRPLFTSGVDRPTPVVKRLWSILHDNGVDLVLNGHDHDYERFLPQTPDGVADSARGIEQIVAGTGGGVLRRMRYPLARNSAFVVHGRFGVLKLTLGSGEYRRAFIDTDGRVWDPGGRQCH